MQTSYKKPWRPEESRTTYFLSAQRILKSSQNLYLLKIAFRNEDKRKTFSDEEKLLKTGCQQTCSKRIAKESSAGRGK